MIQSEHQLLIEFRSLDDGVVGQCRIPPAALEPAQEWAAFGLLRNGVGFADEDVAILEPVTAAPVRPPYATGFRIVHRRNGTILGAAEFPVTFFRRHARHALQQLAREGRVSKDARLEFKLVALPREPEPPAGIASFDVVEVPRVPPMRALSLSELTRSSLRFGDEEPGELPVFVPQSILQEVDELALAAGAVETGGVLIGYLARDASSRELAVVITAQIAACHVEAGQYELVFTPDTWAAVRGAIDLRGEREVIVSWWHTHPFGAACKPECPLEQRQQCPLLQRDIFSEDDILLHETVFPKAFHTALVITHTGSGLRHALYGWHEGTIRRRGFWILNGDRALPPANAEPALVGESPDATHDCHE